eukprot:CAMPEP_0201596068 /NCGR_PEP_ID=MMETSP0190_2-20130828/192867_1 /ASSEMBLY_ACC=CAM_ASM_000263 /TAXON_ID=37353 /ORGANISM="Rosalina sp." /LENGTH=478 /DNA_ID=CAMNT_0048056285 /DNA_START=44 /DNA_END=1480 /DNA_ORIENTATION=+
MASLAAQGQRSGKYRHVFGDAAKPEKQFQDVKNPLTSGEARYVSANNKFVAVSKNSGGGPVYILNIDSPGRLGANIPVLSVQKGKAWDHDFHPFIPNMIATASDDCSLAVTSFPMEGLKENITKADVMLNGHMKKVVLTSFNPSANSILASASFDKTVKVWNIESQECIMTFNQNKDNIYSMEWNIDGSQLATTGKDKQLRIFDPRIPDEAASVESFQGTKSSKVFWIPNLGWIGAVGFSKTARRQLRFWDLKDLSKPIYKNDIDQVSSVLMPYYDNDNGLLYMSGKGDGAVSYSEIINDSKKWYPLSQYRATEPQKGGGWMAKRSCNVFRCEVNRFFKLTKSTIIPISFIVPRKSGADVFQEDIFPDTFAGKPALSADEWLSGENKDPVTISMDPEKKEDGDDSQQTTFVKKKTYQELEDENKELRARVAELEAQLNIGGGDGGDGDGDAQPADNNDGGNDDYNAAAAEEDDADGGD